MSKLAVIRGRVSERAENCHWPIHTASVEHVFALAALPLEAVRAPVNQTHNYILYSNGQ